MPRRSTSEGNRAQTEFISGITTGADRLGTNTRVRESNWRGGEDPNRDPARTVASDNRGRVWSDSGEAAVLCCEDTFGARDSPASSRCSRWCCVGPRYLGGRAACKAPWVDSNLGKEFGDLPLVAASHILRLGLPADFRGRIRQDTVEPTRCEKFRGW